MTETSVPQTKAPPGFRAWLDPYRISKANPYHYDRVETWNSRHGRAIENPHTMDPLRNVAGLYWRPIEGQAK